MIMKNLIILFVTAFILIGCVKEIKNNDRVEKRVDFALAIHGGAGYIYKGRYTEEEEKEAQESEEKSG